MIRAKKLFLLLMTYVAITSLAHAETINPPRVFLLDAKKLEATKQQIRNGDSKLVPALAKLEREAQKALTAGPFSVTSKEVTPPSGDKHDYMSQAPYFWADPSKPDGLPYIRREVNEIGTTKSTTMV